MVVETDDAPGFRRGRKLKKLGMDSADTSELFFEDVSLPAENLLGTEEGQGFDQLMKELPQERLIVAIHAVAMMERALALTIDYVKERKAFGKAIIEFQNTQFELAECKTEATIAKVFLDHCIGAHVEGRARYRHRLDGEILASPTRTARSSTAACNCSAATAIWTNIRSRGIYRDARVHAHLCGDQRDHEAADREEFTCRPRASERAGSICRSELRRCGYGPLRSDGSGEGGEDHARRIHLRPRAHAARTRQGRRRAARGDRAQSRGAGARRDQGAQQARSARWSTTWCWAASIRSAKRAATSRAPPRCVAGFGDEVPGVQINRFCASGLDAVNFAAAEIMSGQHDMTIGGGVESMSRVGIGASGGAWPVDPSIARRDLFHAAGHLRRPDRDQIRLLARRRRRLCGREPEARGEVLGRGPFSKSVVPVKDVERPDAPRQGRAHAADDDDADARRRCSRPSCRWARWAASMRSRCRSIPRSRRSTTCTRRQFVRHRRRRRRGADRQQGGGQARRAEAARAHRAFANIGSEPAIMLTGPIRVTEKVLKRAGMTTSDIDLFELNEAFASVVLRYMQAFDIPHDKINVNGGAIAMGHPLGATGAMILGTVLDELERTGKSTALVTLAASASGMGTATIIERVLQLFDPRRCREATDEAVACPRSTARKCRVDTACSATGAVIRPSFSRSGARSCRSATPWASPSSASI